MNDGDLLPEEYANQREGFPYSYDPSHTQLASDGVAELHARRVRDIDTVVLQRTPPITCKVDIEPKPSQDEPGQPDNMAHAQVYLDPDIDNDKVFRRLRVGLARVADERTWATSPAITT